MTALLAWWSSCPQLFEGESCGSRFSLLCLRVQPCSEKELQLNGPGSGSRAPVGLVPGDGGCIRFCSFLTSHSDQPQAEMKLSHPHKD